MSKRAFTLETEKELMARYAAGETVNALGKSYGVSPETISNTLKRLGIPRDRHQKRTTVEQADKIVEMCLSGVSRKDAAGTFGFTVETARKLVKKRGVQLRIGRPPTCEVNHAAFDVLTPDVAYWMGFFWADGCVHQDAYGSPALILGLAEKDEAHLMKFRAFLSSTHAITRHKKTATSFGGDWFSFRVRSQRLCEVLGTRGFAKKDARIPDDVLANSRDFWRGVVDGDGSIGVNLNRLREPQPCVQLAGQRIVLETFCSYLRKHALADLTPFSIPGTFKISTFTSENVRAAPIVRHLYAGATVGLARKMRRASEIIAGSLNCSTPYEEGKSTIKISNEIAVEIATAA